jgi:hypothetical protein
MDLPVIPELAVETPAPEPSLNVGQRFVAIFTRPAQAWTGLRQHAQWWFPLVIIAIFAAAFAAALHHRALLPMMSAAWRDQVANGNMSAEQLQKMEDFFGGPKGMLITVVQQLLILPIIQLLMALLVWFSVGFVLGRPLTYRLSLEVASWAGLVTIPAQILTGIIAWTRETMKGVHVGFGLLLPDTDTPSRLMIFLGAVLDALGPLSIWYVAVLVLGASALSGAPRKQTAWVLGGVYFALVLLFGGLGAMFTPVSG